MSNVLSVSFFPRLNQYGNEEIALEELIRLIRTRRWHGEIVAYRTMLKSGDKAKAAQLKSLLPGFTPSGVFEGGHKATQLKGYNQVVSLDFDDVAQLAVLLALLRGLVYTRGCFVSPGGEGVKVFVRVDSGVEDHQWAFFVVRTYYERLSGCETDVKCKDICRCCYVSSDDEAWYNPDSAVFPVPRVSEKVRCFLPAWFQKNPCREGNRNHTVYRLACEANRRGIGEDELCPPVVALLQAETFTEAEITQVIHSAYQGNSAEHAAATEAKGTIRNEKARAAFQPEDSLTGPGGEEGESLREQTPFLPADLHERLPKLLSRVVSLYSLPRERDMVLLGAATVLSACLPGVWGVYNRKKVFPHLYTVIVAPAANGKGCVDDMRCLASAYASYIEVETAREEADYLQRREEWEVKCADAHRRHLPVRMADAPLPATTHYFYLPAQNTKAKLLLMLRDNAETGGLLADSEIDTLITANRQDFGAFDDLLRKAFHHEPVGSTRKTDNEMIRIPLPRLAMLLAGTPGQFTRLIPSAENGLMSRLLLYTFRERAVWQDVSPLKQGEDLEKELDNLAEQVLALALRLRAKPLKVELTQSQWNRLNNSFSRLLQEADLLENEEFLSVVKRYGLIAFRLCMVFTALEKASEGYVLNSYYCSEPHFQAALDIIMACLEHSRLLMTQLHREKEIPELRFPRKFEQLLTMLPSHFTLHEAYEMAAPSGLGERTVRKWINKCKGLYLNAMSRGEYQKKLPPVA